MTRRPRFVPAYKARAARRAWDAEWARKSAAFDAMNVKLMAQIQQMQEAQEAHDRAMEAFAARAKGASNA